ncbi:hypothetical protein F5Y07DRAFT_318127 [Xylaria sp. FL0933]|nr:hypothetical protein F5Y07DRAFT_318127 [Xylaria sp. FL0933]
MFGTLKAGKKANAGSMVFVEQNKHIRSASGVPHIACTTCRDRKLKCTGEPSGCKRCRSSQTKCEYPPQSEDKRGGKGRKLTEPKATVPGAAEHSFAINVSTSQDSARKPGAGSTNAEQNNNNMEFDVSLAEFPDFVNSGGFEEMLLMDSPALLDRISTTGQLGIGDSTFTSQLLDIEISDMPSEFAIDHGRVASASGSDNNSNASTSLGTNLDPALSSNYPLLQTQWQQKQASPQGSQSTGSKNANGLRSSMSWTDSASSQSSSREHSRAPTVTSSSQKQQLKRPPPESSSSGSGSDSDSHGERCRCSEKALRLLEKVPSNGERWSGTSSDSDMSDSGVSRQGSGSPDRRDTPPQMDSHSPISNTAFAQAIALFLGHFSRSVGHFAIISACGKCVHTSSFCMVLLMVAQGLSGRLNTLLRKHGSTRNSKKELNSRKLTLTICGHPIEYDDPLPLLATLLAGKICKLAASIFTVKAVCAAARWAPYAKGFEEVEATLRERMSDLESMM